MADQQKLVPPTFEEMIVTKPQAPSYADPCGPDCAWCDSVRQAMQEVCSWTGHEWEDAGDGGRSCEKCQAYEEGAA